MFQYYSPMIFPLRRRPLLPAARPAPVAQLNNSIGGWGNDFINLGTFTGSPSPVNVTIVNSTPYAVQPGDYYLGVNIAAPATVVLPASPIVGQVLIIKDIDGDANTNNITVSGNGNTIDGAATYVLNTDYASITLVFNGTEWNVV